ncbi:MAG: PIN domain-containing protein [Nitrosomonas sp.]|nr:PIN domain-containing protein [Nitrosomonas sp.]
MPLTVRAKVVDIRTDTPISTDRFLVDTNAWYWLFYPRASQVLSTPRSYQLTDYPSYIEKAINSKSSLHCCALNFSELAHNIEKVEREIYADKSNLTINTKDFRHNYVGQRGKILDLINEIWSDVESMSVFLDMNLDITFMESALSLFPSVSLDGYDLFMAEMALKTGVTKVITDDGDYATVPGLTIFTSNSKIIAEAAKQRNKLITR